MTRFVVLVPGLTGSVLSTTDGSGEIIWPPNEVDLEWLQKYFGPLKATDVVRDFFTVPIYQPFIDYLGSLGYSEANKRLQCFPYDWRQDNAVSAQALANFLSRKFGGFPSVSVVLIGHSMGGLVCRYMLENGLLAPDMLAKIERVVTIGTPHMGAPKTLPIVLGTEGTFFLEQFLREVTNDPRYPSAYQMLPPPWAALGWWPAGLTPYASGIGAGLGLTPACLASAAAFWTRIWNLAERDPPKPYSAFVSSGLSTIVRTYIEKDALGDYHAFPVTQDAGGDGTVPSWSAGPSGTLQRLACGGDHIGMLEDPILQAKLAALLRAPKVAIARLKSFAVSPSRRRVLPGDVVTFTVAYSGVGSLDAQLILERVPTSQTRRAKRAAKAARNLRIAKPVPVRGAGEHLRSIGLELVMPRQPGVYRLVLQSRVTRKVLAMTGVVVAAAKTDTPAPVLQPTQQA